MERELVQARLKDAESQCALKEMQDKILDMEKVVELYYHSQAHIFPCRQFCFSTIMVLVLVHVYSISWQIFFFIKKFKLSVSAEKYGIGASQK